MSETPSPFSPKGKRLSEDAFEEKLRLLIRLGGPIQHAAVKPSMQSAEQANGIVEELLAERRAGPPPVDLGSLRRSVKSWDEWPMTGREGDDQGIDLLYAVVAEAHKILASPTFQGESPADPWNRDMDAAPKDGTHVLIFERGRRKVARFSDGCWLTVPGDYFAPKVEAWMPLFDPPSVSTKGGGE